MKKSIEGYFSLEAALVLPMVLWVILFIIYMLFFQYNRCLLEQDLGILALQGTVMEAENNTQRAEQLRSIAENMDSGKYIAWDMEEVYIRTGQGKVSVQRTGRLRFPFRWENKEFVWWSTQAVYENSWISPVTFIRTCRRIIQDEEIVATKEGRE